MVFDASSSAASDALKLGCCNTVRMRCACVAALDALGFFSLTGLPFVTAVEAVAVAVAGSRTEADAAGLESLAPEKSFLVRVRVGDDARSTGTHKS